MASKSTPKTEELSDKEFLRRGLEMGEGFQLYIASADSLDAREQLVEQLQESPRLDVGVVRGNEMRRETLAESITHTFQGQQQTAKRPVVVVTDLDESATADPRILSRLNEQRNELIRDSNGAVIVVAGSKLVGSMRKAAPDTWSVRSADLDVDPTPSKSSEAAEVTVRLRPIKNGTTEEREELETELTKELASARRAEIFHRLAEITETSGDAPGIIADFYLKAAKLHSNNFKKSLALINAGRALFRTGDGDRAEGILRQVVAETADSAVRSYALFSLGTIKQKDDPKAALSLLDEAIRLASQSDQLELVARSRLERLGVLRETGANLRAFEEAHIAEEEAERLGTALDKVQKLQLLRGHLAAVLGLSSHVSSAWNRFLKEVQPTDFRRLCQSVIRMDEDREPHSAKLAWRSLCSIADERHAADSLAQGVLLALENHSIWNGDPFDFETWQGRFRILLHGPEFEKYQGGLALLAIRQDLNRDHQDEIPKFRQLLPSVPPNFGPELEPFWGLLAEGLHLHDMVVSGDRDAALQRLGEKLLCRHIQRALTEWTGSHAQHDRTKLEDLPFPERTLVLLTIDILGVDKTILALLDTYPDQDPHR